EPALLPCEALQDHGDRWGRAFGWPFCARGGRRFDAVEPGLGPSHQLRNLGPINNEGPKGDSRLESHILHIERRRGMAHPLNGTLYNPGIKPRKGGDKIHRDAIRNRAFRRVIDRHESGEGLDEFWNCQGHFIAYAGYFEKVEGNRDVEIGVDRDFIEGGAYPAWL